MKRPHPYQKEIIKRAVDVLSRKNRATVVMPCASGKTLIALWIFERMKAKSNVVFVPTLGLLPQTAREFLANT
jgi:superfamily II DNA or RNA helicase